jgi:protein-S-isoprenylcysteine O-methyltransferase Ste14
VVRGIVFVILSTALAYVSRASLQAPRFHGFWRYFAWECILALVFLNFVDFRQWFSNPLSVRQLLSWCLLIGSIVPAVYGVHALRTHGDPAPQRARDEALLWVETTTQLVTTGAFRYIRHPLYSSLLLLAWGVFLKRPSWLSVGAVLAATLFLVATAKCEERENLRHFGAAYRAYMQHTKMFVPFLV